MPRTKPSIEEARKMASCKKGLCLSSTCSSTRDKLKWKCKNGHVWETSYRVIKRGSWCPECSYDKKRLTLKEIKKIVKSKFDGYCLSKNYKNNLEKLTWKCHQGHIWQASYSNIQNHNRWCPYCAGNAKLTIEQMQKIAKKRGGKCLSSNYINNSTKLKWECSQHHTWDMRPNDIIKKNNWCPICSALRREKYCKIILEE